MNLTVPLAIGQLRDEDVIVYELERVKSLIRSSDLCHQSSYCRLEIAALGSSLHIAE